MTVTEHASTLLAASAAVVKPEGQAVHSVAFVELEKVPTGHGLQVLLRGIIPLTQAARGTQHSGL